VGLVRVVITGGCGFIGSKLAKRLEQRGSFRGKPIEELVIADSRPSGERSLALDVADRDAVEALLADGADAVFHLASMVSAESELDFEGALRVNLDGTRNVLEACRGLGTPPVVVFTSTAAVFGGVGLPEQVSDATKPVPQTTYGATKAVCELLVNDYTRKGFVDGRTARLPTVVVRPGAPNAAASSFASSIVREPLCGRDYDLPVGLETRLPVIGARTAVECLVLLAECEGAAVGLDRAVNLPSLSVTAAELLASVERIGADRRLGRVRLAPDSRIEAIVTTWAVATSFERATALGLPGDESIDSIVREFAEDYLD